MPTQILWHRKWVLGKTCTKRKAQITSFFFLFWETKAQITSRILFEKLQEHLDILSKTMCSQWASQGIQLNPFKDRATQPINSPSWYIDMGLYDPSLQFTIWAFWPEIFSSQILLRLVYVFSCFMTMPVFPFSFRNGPQDPLAFATWYVLTAEGLFSLYVD